MTQKKPVATHNNGGLKDPGSLVLNINSKFEKFTAFTTDGNKLPFYVHMSDKYASKRDVRLQRKGAASLPATSHRKPHHQQAMKLAVSQRKQSLENGMVPFGSLDNMGGAGEHPETAYLLTEGDHTFGQK